MGAHLPSQCPPQNSLHASIPEDSHEALLESGIFEKFAALLDKDLLLFCAAALIAEPAIFAVKLMSGQERSVGRLCWRG